MNTRFLVFAGFVLSVLVLLTALGGIFLPSVYSRETASWAAQGTGQDWVNLVLVVPWLFLSSVATSRGSRSALFLLGGAFVYLCYSYALYAFDVHFNSLFLLYCATLGFSFFGLLVFLLGAASVDARTWFEEGTRVRLPAFFQIGVAAVFSLLWLGQIVPALLDGRDPVGLDEVGLVTNPVHVLDLSLLLPSLFIAGFSLLRGHSLGFLLTPVMLVFNVIMSAAIGGMMIAMRVRGIPMDLSVAYVMIGVSILSVGVLAGFLRRVKRV